MPVIDAVAGGDRPFVIRGYGRTYEMTEAEFNAAMRAADAVSEGADLLTTGEAAALLGVSARTVARLVDSGRIPARRLSDTGHRMVGYHDVMAYREARARRGRLLEDARALAAGMGAYDDADGTSVRRSRG